MECPLCKNGNVYQGVNCDHTAMHLIDEIIRQKEWNLRLSQSNLMLGQENKLFWSALDVLADPANYDPYQEPIVVAGHYVMPFDFARETLSKVTRGDK